MLTRQVISLSHYRTLWLWLDLLIVPDTFYFHFQYDIMRKSVLNCMIKIITFFFSSAQKYLQYTSALCKPQDLMGCLELALQWHIHWMPTVPNPPPTFYLYLHFMCNCICICFNLALQRHIERKLSLHSKFPTKLLEENG